MDLIAKIKDKVLRKYIVSFTCKQPLKAEIVIGNLVKPTQFIALCNKLVASTDIPILNVEYKSINFMLINGKVSNFKDLSLKKDIKTIGALATYLYDGGV